MTCNLVLLGSVLLIAATASHTALSSSVQNMSQPRRISIMAKRFAFVPAELTLKKDEPVVFVLQSEDVLHGIRFKELHLDAVIRKNTASELAFTPHQTGTFIGHCSRFCGTGHGEMTLTLNVTE